MIDTLALWMMSLTWTSHFRFGETVMPSNFKQDTEISEEMGLRKQGEDLRNQISITMDLEWFTAMSRSKASSPILLLIKFLKEVSTTIRSSKSFSWSGNSFARLLIMDKKGGDLGEYLGARACGQGEDLNGDTDI